MTMLEQTMPELTMPAQPMPAQGSIAGRAVDARAGGKDAVIWDRALTGFGVRVYPSGAKVYIVQCRGPAGRTRITLGRHGVISAEEARRRARPMIARIRAGADAGLLAPRPGALTVAALAERYLREHVAVRCKPTTAARYRLAIERHIVPALGRLPASAVTRTHVADLQHGLSDRPALANLVVATLSRMIDQAFAWGSIPEARNPCRAAYRYKERRRERFLTEAEFRRLGRALRALEDEGRVSAHAAAAIRLLMLTGCRRNEILTLRWADVRLEEGEIRLRDSKTGPRTVSLSRAAVKVLAALPRAAGNPWVVPGRQPGAPLSGIFEPWRRVRSRAGLGDVRIHDLRHSYASRALALGESLPVIAKLLGHSRIQTTARYAHLARDSVRAAAVRIADGIWEDVLPRGKPGLAGVPGGWDAGAWDAGAGASADDDAPRVREVVKAAAARVAADIGADILRPCRADRPPVPACCGALSSRMGPR